MELNLNHCHNYIFKSVHTLFSQAFSQIRTLFVVNIFNTKIKTNFERQITHWSMLGGAKSVYSVKTKIFSVNGVRDL